MSFLERLSLRGVRSFSPYASGSSAPAAGPGDAAAAAAAAAGAGGASSDANTLELYRPLTLVVGPNGAGKCLGRGTRVMMHDGSARAVETLRVGEDVLGPRGEPRRIARVVCGREPMVRVALSAVAAAAGRSCDASAFVCSLSHVLTLGCVLPDGGGVHVVDLPVRAVLALPHGVRQRLFALRAGPVAFAHAAAIPPAVLRDLKAQLHARAWRAVGALLWSHLRCASVLDRRTVLGIVLDALGRVAGAAVRLRLPLPHTEDTADTAGFLSALVFLARSLGVGVHRRRGASLGFFGAWLAHVPGRHRARAPAAAADGTPIFPWGPLEPFRLRVLPAAPYFGFSLLGDEQRFLLASPGFLLTHNSTLLEALHFACSGEFPPGGGAGARGQAFVHDPRLPAVGLGAGASADAVGALGGLGLAGAPSLLGLGLGGAAPPPAAAAAVRGAPPAGVVHAQVRLGFHSVLGNSFVCTRSLQVSLTRPRSSRVPARSRAGGASAAAAAAAGDDPDEAAAAASLQQRLEFKTLDSALMFYDSKGKRVSKTYRCADIDRDVPKFLGVSKAILDHVIFCFPVADHQLLTSAGWLFCEDARRRFEADQSLLFAGFDPRAQRIVYERPRALVCNPPSDAPLVEFSSSSQRAGGRFSLVATQEHEMYVRCTARDGGQFRKRRASELARRNSDNEELQFLAVNDDGGGECEPTTLSDAVTVVLVPSAQRATWCATMPSGFVVVRRARRDPARGTLLLHASRATVQGNCHQEEANWPCGDPRSVKTHFDEIFAATRYTKAIEALKTQRKETTAALHTARASLDTLAERRKRVEALQHERTAHLEEIARLDDELARTPAQITACAADVRRLRRALSGSAERAAKLRALGVSRRQLAATHRETEAALKVRYSESELAAAQAGFADHFAALRRREAALSNSVLPDLQRDKLACEREVQRLGVLFGELRSEKASLAARRRERNERARAFCRAHRMSLPRALTDDEASATADDDTVQHVLQRGTKQVESLRASLAEAKRTNASALATLGEKLARARGDLRELRETARREEAAGAQLEKKAAETEAQIAELHSKHSRLAEVARALADARRHLELERAAVDEAAVAREVAELRARKGAAEQELDALSELTEKLSLHANQRAAIDLKKREQTASQARLDKVLRTHAAAFARFTECADCTAEPARLPARVQERAATVAARLERARAQKTSADAELAFAEKERAGAARELEAAEVLEREHAGTLAEVLACGQPLPEVLRAANVEADKKKEAVAKNRSLHLMYRQFRELAVKARACPLCERVFAGGAGAGAGEAEFRQFLKTVDAVIARTPAKIAQRERELHENEVLVGRLSELMPAYHAFAAVREERIPAARSAAAAAQARLATLREASAAAAAELDAATDLAQDAQALGEAAREVAREHAEFSRFAREVRAAEAELRALSDDARSLEDVVLEVRTRKRSVAELDARVDAAQSRLLAWREATLAAESRVQNLREEEAAMANVGEQVKFLRARAAEWSAERAGCATRSAEAAARATSVEATVRQLEAELADERTLRAGSEEALAAEAESAAGAVRALEALAADVRRAAAKLAEAAGEADVVQRKQRADERLAELDRKLSEHAAERGTLQAELAEQEVKRRDLEDNARFFAEVKRIAEVDAEVARVDAQVRTEQNVEPAELQRLPELERELERLRTQQARQEGKRATHDEEAKRLWKALQSPECRTALEEYRAAFVQRQLAAVATADVAKYLKALEKAVMHYHSTKMREVNQIIRELWRATYRSDDIDAIEIRSDDEGRTNYNYRVVMIKGDTALDMRGRCSAGQKVLASLVIRLALAEAFSTQCGVMALDEPTTNLDRRHVASFAQALVSIIDSRKRQENFQLIVITHDEEFVQQLGRTTNADFYWRVYKDLHGYSRVQRRDILELE